MSKKFPMKAVTVAVTLIVSSLASAQTPPDAGQTLQQAQPVAPMLPKESVPLKIDTPPSIVTPPGGQQVQVKGIRFSGNSIFTSDELVAAIGEVADQSLDLAGLRGLGDKITDFYRASGYPFARAFLPPQTLTDGVLQIEIIEGRYGDISATVEHPLIAEQALRWLDALEPGAVIESKSLERATLVMDDLPGIKTSPIIRPGSALGRGDLIVGVVKDTPYDISLGFENHGNRYTGYNRARFGANLNSPFLLGDQISISILGSDQDLWLGSLSYSMPLGYSGLRGTLGLAHTAYELSKEFANSGEGTADVANLGVSYPVVRSQKTNITVSATWQHKQLDDNDLGGNKRKQTNTYPLVVQFDQRDDIAGGGVTFGSVSWTYGDLNRLPDDDFLETRGSFEKWNLDIARMQALPNGFNLYGRLNAQQAEKNLDSSEDLSIAGPGGVRAYPVGELSGDEGWLGQIELRYAAGAFAPYIFYDRGRVYANQDGSGPSRTLSGGGVGMRYQRGGWSADLALAWRDKGGRPSDANESNGEPRAWISVSYRF